MRFPKLAAAVIFALIATPGVVRAQSTSGAIFGRVLDSQGGALPGVAVSVESPSLQGVRTVITTEQGDYLFPLLPSGAYTVTFELQGFERSARTVQVAATNKVPLDVTLGVEGVKETLTVTAQSAEVLTRTAQVALNLKQDLIWMLPNNRDISASLLLAPSVHTTGAAGYVSIAGSMSHQNLFLVNGVTINENVRGQPNAVYIEDAIQETTVATGGISAEFGRFSGGVVNVVTKSGGNTFSGSFRESYHNDNWRTLTPFETKAIANDPAHKDTRLDDMVPTHEYTLGGPILRDKLWFFTAGRIQTLAERRTLAVTNIPYDFTRPNRRYEAKATYSPQANHRLQGTFVKVIDNYENYTFNTATSMDLNSLGTRRQPQALYSANYTGALSSSLFVEALWSRRDSSGIGVGAKSRDLIDGTLVIDRLRNTRYWSDTFCGVCSPERRDNENVNVKASYFLSSRSGGTHSMTFGYDNFNDKRSANNYQSGSDYRIWGTTSFLRGSGENTVIYPQFLGDGTTLIQWNPIPVLSDGNNFRTHGLFVNDTWRVNGRLTANLGLRYDRNQGRDQEGKLVVTTGAVSPRLGVVFDPTGSQKWSVSANVAQFVDAIANTVADASSTAGNTQAFIYAYRGPSINADTSAANPVDTPTAISQVFAWYNANGGSNLPLVQPPNLPGVSTRIGSELKSPKVMEYSAGLSRQFPRGSVRMDYVFRDWRDFYIQRTDLTTGRVTNSLGQQFDLSYIENTSDLTRRYSGATFQGTYRLGDGDLGATYTLSRLWGNNDGESRNAGPTASAAFQYPEYKDASWNYPEGDLSADQRHRARFWVTYPLRWVEGLTLSGVQLLESGQPYGAVAGSGVDPRPYVPDLGYVTAPSGSATAYYYTARDAFRTEGQKRTDVAATYKFGLKSGSRVVDLFFQAQVINVFNSFQLCACGGTVFQNGGAVDLFTIDQTVRTPVVSGGLPLVAFNPFTTTPVEGVNWAKGPNFGTAINRLAYTSPRQLRLTFGVRF
ncbi:MAG: TonB-dependent receptor [Vicinamibacterales bacterium]